jgi:hypothetical protein
MTTNRWVSLAIAALAGCGGSSTNEATTSQVPPAGGEQGRAIASSNMPESAETAGAQDAGAATQAAAAVTVTPATPTPLPPNAHPRVQITAPRDNATVRTDRLEVRLRVTDWPAPEDGRHVHLILDNEPYRRVDDPSRPVALEHLAEGTHVLRAFPGWSTHESVKIPGAFAMAVFHVGRATTGNGFNRSAPLLTYSRPKGDYNGTDADSILLDFYLTNIPNEQLSPTGYRVRYAIDNSATGELTSWAPYHIDHLGDGAHTVTLELLGPDGQPVVGPFNRTERTINVNHAAPAGGEHSAHGAAAGDAGVTH